MAAANAGAIGRPPCFQAWQSPLAPLQETLPGVKEITARCAKQLQDLGGFPKMKSHGEDHQLICASAKSFNIVPYFCLSAVSLGFFHAESSCSSANTETLHAGEQPFGVREGGCHVLCLLQQAQAALFGLNYILAIQNS